MKKILSLFFSIAAGFTMAQTAFPIHGTSNFYTQHQSIRKTVDTTDLSEGGQYMDLKRWEKFWGARVYGHGNFEVMREAMAHRTASGCTSSYTWQNWGPNSSITTFGYPGIGGQVRGMVVDPDNSNTLYVSSKWGGVFSSTNAGVNWQNFYTDNLPFTCVNDIEIAKDASGNKYLFIATGNGLLPAYAVYRYNLTTNSGWVSIGSGLINNTSSDPWTIEELLVNPVDPNIIFAATSLGVYKTSNALATTPTWSQVLANADGIRAVEFKPCLSGCTASSYNTIYASGLDVFTSTTGGGSGSWSSLTGSTGNQAFQGTAQAFTGWNVSKINIATNHISSNYLYANMIITNSSNSVNRVLGRCNLTTGVWSLSPWQGGDATTDRMAFEASENNVDIVYYGNVTGYVYSFASSSVVGYVSPGHSDFHFFRQVGNTLYIGNDGGIFKLNSPESGGGATSLNGQGLNLFLCSKLGVSPVDPDYVATGMQDNQSYDTHGPNAWTVMNNLDPSYGDGAEQIILPNGNIFTETAYNSGGSPVRYLTNNMANERTIGEPCGDWDEAWNKNIAYDYKKLPGSSEPGALYFPDQDGFSICTDPNTSGNCSPGWANITNLRNYPQFSGVNDPYNDCWPKAAGLAVSGISPCTIYFSYELAPNPQYTCNFWGAPTLFKSTTGGDNSPYTTCTPCTTNCWTNLGSLGSLQLAGTISSIVVDNTNDNRVWVASSGYATAGHARKVIFSADGGTTWSDFSTGLPNININCMVRRKGTTDVLFAGTDAGVYYRDNTMTQWQCFGTGIPNTIVTDLDINECSGQLYASLFGRGIWVCPMPLNTDIYDIKNTSTNIINITSNTTWNSSHRVLGSVHVKAPAVLSISGASTIIEFADSRTTGITTNIYVEAGAALNVSSGTLTVSQGCTDLMWDGIILQGQSTQLSQTTSNQPQAYLSGGVIQNARVAFMVGDNMTSPYNGAILKATSVGFYNNGIDAQFNPYIAPGTTEPNNISYFDNCSFNGNAYLNDAVTYGQATTDKHIWFNQVKGVAVKGCAFTTAPGLMGSSYGIYSTDATFSVGRRCNIINTITGACAGSTSSFTGLQYGVYAQSSNPLKNFTVDQALFTNCSGGIYESGINYSTVTSNTFAINTPVPPIWGHACSLNGTCVAWFHYINSCNSFTHQENVHTVTGTTQHVIGTIFNGTAGSAASLSYKNSYNGLYQSQLVQGGNTNLQLQCNQSSGTTNADIIVTSGAFPTQGANVNSQSLANNTFTRPNFSATSDINSATSFSYYYNGISSTGNQVPTYRTSNVTGNACNTYGTFNYTSACPSKLGGGGSGGGSSRMSAGTQTGNGTGGTGNGSTQSKDAARFNHEQSQFAIDQAITKALNDPSAGGDSAVVALLKKDDSEKGKTDLAYYYIGKKDYGNAQPYINAVKGLPGCIGKGQYLQQYKALMQQNKTWAAIAKTGGPGNDIIDYAFDSLGNGFGNARSIVSMVNKIHNYEVIERNTVSAGASNETQDGQGMNSTVLMLRAYPNPFKDELRVSVILPEGMNEITIQLMAPATGVVVIEKKVTSRQQEVVFDTKGLSSGLYLIGIEGGSFPSQFIKVVLAR